MEMCMFKYNIREWFCITKRCASEVTMGTFSELKRLKSLKFSGTYIEQPGTRPPCCNTTQQLTLYKRANTQISLTPIFSRFSYVTACSHVFKYLMIYRIFDRKGEIILCLVTYVTIGQNPFPDVLGWYA